MCVVVVVVVMVVSMTVIGAFGSFLGSVPTEPTDQWTVDQVLHWWLLRAKSETDAACEQTIERLSKQLDQGMKTLWSDHEQVKAIICEGENVDPQQRPVDASDEKVDVVKTESPSLEPGTLKVEIMAGYYSGQVFHLDVSANKTCMIGRSQSKRFTKNGISLPRDAEVSTTHGKFLMKNGKYLYIDDGSTNGSYVNGRPLEAYVELTLEPGMELLVGATVMKVSFAN